MINNNKKTIPIVLGKPSVSKEEVEEIAEDVVRDIAYEKEDEIFIGKTTDETPIIVLDGDEEGVNITPTEISFDTPDGENKNITPEKIDKWDAMATAGLTREVVETLPTEGIKTNVIYLVPNGESEGENVYTEYMYISGKWETVGSTRVDLSDYYTKEEVDAEINKIPKHWFGTQEEYDALGEYDENTIYHIEGGAEGGRKAFRIDVNDTESEETIAQATEIINYAEEVGNADFDVYVHYGDTNWYVATKVIFPYVSGNVSSINIVTHHYGGDTIYLIEKNGDDVTVTRSDWTNYLVSKEIIDYFFEDYLQEGYKIKEDDLRNAGTIFKYGVQDATFLRFYGNYAEYAEIQIGRYIYSFQQWDDEEGTRWYRWVDNDDFKKEEILTDDYLNAIPTKYRIGITGYGETENVSEITGYKVLDVDTFTIQGVLNQFVADNLQNYITYGFLKPFEFVLFEQQNYGYDREYNTTSSADITLTSQTSASITISANAQIEDKLLSLNAVGSINAITMGTTWDVVELSMGSTLEQGGGGSNSWYGTQAEFEALGTYDETGNTQYFISDKLDYKTDIKNLPYIPKKVSELPNDAHYLQGVKKINGISMRGEGDVDIMKIINDKTVYLTQSEYDALEEKDAEKLYIIETTNQIKTLTFTFDDGSEETINVLIQ